MFVDSIALPQTREAAILIREWHAHRLDCMLGVPVLVLGRRTSSRLLSPSMWADAIFSFFLLYLENSRHSLVYQLCCLPSSLFFISSHSVHFECFTLWAMNTCSLAQCPSEPEARQQTTLPAERSRLVLSKEADDDACWVVCGRLLRDVCSMHRFVSSGRVKA